MSATNYHLLDTNFQIDDVKGFEKYLAAKFNDAKGRLKFDHKMEDIRGFEEDTEMMEKTVMTYHQLQALKKKPK